MERRASTTSLDSDASMPLEPPTDVAELIPAEQIPSTRIDADVVYAGESAVEKRLRGVVSGQPGSGSGSERVEVEMEPSREEPDTDAETQNDYLIAKLLAEQFAEEDRLERERERERMDLERAQLESQRNARLAPGPPPTISTAGPLVPPPKPPRTRAVEIETGERERQPGPLSQLSGPPTSSSLSVSTTSIPRKPSPAWLQAQKDSLPASRPAQARAEADLPEPPSPERPSVLRRLDSTDSISSQPQFPPFLSLLKTPALSPLLSPLRSFLANFGNVPLDRRPAEFQAYMARLHPLVNSVDSLRVSGGLEHALEGIEKLLLTKSYSQTFAPQPDRDADLRLYKNLIRHTWVRPEMLDIHVSEGKQGMWVIAADEVRKLDQYRSPRDKLTVLVNAVRVLVLMLDGQPRSPVKTMSDSFARAQESPVRAPESPSVAPPSPSSTSSIHALPNADLLLPTLIALLIVAQPRALPSNLHFIQRYRSQPMSGEESYILTTFSAASEWASGMAWRELRVAEEEWEARCREADTKYEETQRRRAEAERIRVEAERLARGSQATPNGQTGESLADTLLKPLQFLGKLLESDNSPPRNPSRPSSFNAGSSSNPPQPPARAVSQPAVSHTQQQQPPSPFLARMSEAERVAYSDFDAQMAWALRQSSGSELPSADERTDEVWEDASGLIEPDLGAEEEEEVELVRGRTVPPVAKPDPVDLLTGENEEVEGLVEGLEPVRLTADAGPKVEAGEPEARLDVG